MLKRTLLYCLLVLYLAVQLKPLSVLVQDLIAHTFFKMEHLATIHYENGKYHLHAELENISKAENDIKKNKTEDSKTTEKNPQKVEEILSIQVNEDLIAQNFYAPLSKNTPGFLTIISPPPKS